MTRKKARTRRDFGHLRKLPSNRYQAKYVGPDGSEYRAPSTFPARIDAEGWLADERRLIDLGTWTRLEERERKAEAASMTVRELIEIWLTSSDFKVSTAQSHRRKLNTRVLRDDIPGKFDSLADLKIAEVDRDRVKAWWLQVVAEWPTQKSTNASAYKRLHTAFEYATEELRLISENPVKVKGAGRAPRPESRDRALISLEEAKALTEHAPARLRIGTQLLLWSGLRIGELLDLRRKDVVIATAGTVTIRIRRNAQRITDEETGKQVMISLETPKTDAGNRDIVLPNTVGEALKEHLKKEVGGGQEALIITTMTTPPRGNTPLPALLLPIGAALLNLHGIGGLLIHQLIKEFLCLFGELFPVGNVMRLVMMVEFVEKKTEQY